MAGERAGHSLQATALVNEAYIRLIDVRQMDWQNRAHLFAVAAQGYGKWREQHTVQLTVTELHRD